MMVGLTPTQKFLLAVSLPITLVFLYFLFRKNDDDDDEEEATASRVVTSQHTTIEIHVPPHCVGAVIGQQGSQIKQIQEITRTRINFKGSEGDKDKDRVVLVRGTQEGVHRAELLIRKIIVDQPSLVSEDISVPQIAVGRIIGRDGTTIRALTRQSKAKIVIERTESRDAVTNVNIRLTGSQAAVDTAKLLIEEKVAEEREFRVKDAIAESRRHSGVKNNEQPTTIHDLQTTTTTTSAVTPLSSTDYTLLYVTSVENPHHFWIQRLSSVSVELDALMSRMTDYYGKQQQGSSVSELQVGDIVAAPYEDDTQWYRAQVAEVSDDKVDLYYVDFGDSLWLPSQHTRQLTEEFVSCLPFQAVECCLSNVEPITDGEWPLAAVETFETLCQIGQWRALNSVTVGQSDTSYGTTLYHLRLIDTNGPQDVDIGAELVRLGHARHSQDTPGANNTTPVVQVLKLTAVISGE